MNNTYEQPLPSEPLPALYEHLLVISPSENVWKEVMEIKEQFNERYQHIQAIKSNPHIKLVNFGATPAKEEILLLQIGAVAKSHGPFEVLLKGINHFKTHTIFIDVADQKPIVRLVQSLNITLNLPPATSFFSWRPHMTIAKGLEENKFQQAMTRLSSLKYSASFPADKIVLMKRAGKFDKYEIVKEFLLGQ